MTSTAPSRTESPSSTQSAMAIRGTISELLLRSDINTPLSRACRAAALGRRRGRRGTWRRLGGNLVHEALRPHFELQARILPGLGAGDSCDPLDKVEHARGRVALLGQHGLDHLG